VKRRHLFEHAYPMCTATLLAGSEVLLARSFFLLADSSQRVMNSFARCESRENRSLREHCLTASAQHRAARAHPYRR